MERHDCVALYKWLQNSQLEIKRISGILSNLKPKITMRLLDLLLLPQWLLRMMFIIQMTFWILITGVKEDLAPLSMGVSLSGIV